MGSDTPDALLNNFKNLKKLKNSFSTTLRIQGASYVEGIA